MRFAGYAAIFDRVDRGGDVIRRGAFQGSLAKPIPLLWQHDRRRRIGAIEMLSEDKKGLRIIAKVDEGVTVNEGSGLSFGYRVKAARREPTVRELIELDLLEVSVVTSPMQPLARVHAIESRLAEPDPAMPAATTGGETDRAEAENEHCPG